MGLLLLVSMFSVLFLQLVDLSETTVLVEPTATYIPAAAPSPSSAPPAPAPIQVSPTPDSGVGTIVTRQLFDELYPNRNKTFYTYDAFIVAAKSFPTFGNQGSHKIRLREIAAYSAHVQQETAGNKMWSKSQNSVELILQYILAHLDLIRKHKILQLGAEFVH